MKVLAGLLAPALLSVAAASQTIVVRPLPFTGVPRILPQPYIGVPHAPARLPSPLPLPLPLSLPSPLRAPMPVPEPTMALAAPSALPVVRMDADNELHPALRALRDVALRLEQATAAPARVEQKEKDAALAEVFDAESLGIPEDDLERELGLR